MAEETSTHTLPTVQLRRRQLIDAAKSIGRRVLGTYYLDECDLVQEFLGPGPGRVMLDVGAAFGESLAPFAADGWEVHAFEPDPSNRETLVRDYGRHSNVTIVPSAVSDAPGSLTLFTSPESPGISSLSPFTPAHVPSGEVPVTTLGEYLSSTPDIERIDFLKIDVEGFEANVLAGHDWSMPPGVIVLEFENRKTLPLGYSWRDLADELLARGYGVVASEWYPIERYGAVHRWRAFHPYPATLHDENAWGNLIATRERYDDLVAMTSRTERRYRARERFERARRSKLYRAHQ